MGSGLYFGRDYYLRPHELPTQAIGATYSGLFAYAAISAPWQRVRFEEYDAIVKKKHEIKFGELVGLLTDIPELSSWWTGTLSVSDAPPGSHWIHWSRHLIWMPGMRFKIEDAGGGLITLHWVGHSKFGNNVTSTNEKPDWLKLTSGAALKFSPLQVVSETVEEERPVPRRATEEDLANASAETVPPPEE